MRPGSSPQTCASCDRVGVANASSTADGYVNETPATNLSRRLGESPYATHVARVAAVVFVVGGVLALRIPRSETAAPVEEPTVTVELHAPSIVYAGTAMAVLRGTVGFLTFFLAFHLKQVGEPAWFYGLALASGSLGGFLGVVVSPVARRRVREETMLSAALLVAAAVALLCARSGGRPATLVIALTIAVAAQFGRIAFDSLLQRDGPEHLRGRNFARFETRFQLVWVAGALIPVALLDVLTTREGYLALGVALAVAGATYVLSLRSLAAGSPPRAPDEDPEP